MSDKIKKVVAVVFLTLLIWAWAYLSLEREVSLWGSIEVSPATGPELLATFKGGDSSFPIKLTFKGPPAKVSEIERLYRAALMDPKQERLVFYYLPQDFGHTQTDTYTLDLLEFIRTNPAYQEMALTLEACEPARLEVDVEALVKKQLPVQCLNESGTPLKAADIKPGQVAMYVQSAYTGPAYIQLSSQQIEAARKSPIRQRPYVSFGLTGPRRMSAEEVRISLPTTEELNEYPFQPQNIGFIFSRNSTIPAKYRIQIENESDLRTIQIRATEEALNAYQKMRQHLLIEIRNDDANLTEIPAREVIFNFPEEFVRSGQIEATASKSATIKLVPLTPAPAGG
jgi:hypothetical protein